MGTPLCHPSPVAVGILFWFVLILLTANLYVPATHFKHPVFIAHLSNLPSFNSCHQSRVEEALLDWRKGNSWLFLKIGLFFQVFGIHIPQKCMPCSESLAHTQARQVWPVCHTSKSYLPLFYSSWKDTTKEKSPAIDLCAASPVESVGVLHVRQLRDRHSNEFNLKMPQESFKLRFLEHAMG